MSVRLSDVAQAAGVSVGTVSKALGSSNDVSMATRDRLRALAAEMGYRPNGNARRLRSGYSRTVGMLTSDSVGRFSTPVLLGAGDAVGAEGMSVLLCDSRGDDIRKRHHLHTLLEHGIDGLITLASTTDDQPSLGDIGVPVVYAYGASTDPADFSVVPDEDAGAATAVEHLLALGRRRIAHVTGPVDFAATRRRAAAVERTLTAQGLQLVPPGPLLGDWTEQWGRVATDMVLRAGEVDAVFCGSDAIARGVTDALRDRGLRIPQDVAVVGYDNWEAMTTGSRPPLTSIDPDLEAVGQTAARALLEAVQGTPRAGVQRLPTRLVLRESTLG
ncbi:LacI family DNA-binding transcriptional regulator [Modestobacter sp. Leaf380]|uniref:LacI family DNA-binding transcriptional regulator n=1 Tax=Modestobacter sp. Leaf380 TaxID=1736356 RepID=UPI0006FE6FD0|nr:LacI family DNA-binding transcriptional regulator [Modestobacter sp. Leaf380]KQS66706.1 LacI family transcriptional regulator [Modestobacter sp. Leaf380]